MISIEDIGRYIPPETIDNLSKLSVHQVSGTFITDKIGFLTLARKPPAQSASDLCVLAYKDLESRNPDLSRDQVDAVLVCTQNGDYQLPHTSAVVHSKLSLPSSCATLDISLGCSGYVYSIIMARNFMEANGLKTGLVFTSDPYSQIIDPTDKNTDLLFGDAATVTLLSERGSLRIGRGVFCTVGSKYQYLIKRDNEKLVMNGKGIFDFAMKYVPPLIARCLEENGISHHSIDLYIFHQASKYMLHYLGQRMGLDQQLTPFEAETYGNTVSSSIPLVLQKYLSVSRHETIILCGFGVGLSAAAVLLNRYKEKEHARCQ